MKKTVCQKKRGMHNFHKCYWIVNQSSDLEKATRNRWSTEAVNRWAMSHPLVNHEHASSAWADTRNRTYMF